jgi:hypothetical protein
MLSYARALRSTLARHAPRALAATVCVSGVIVAGALAQPATSARRTPAQVDYALETGGLVKALLNDRRPSSTASDGAFGPNARWERGQASTWNVAFQRVGENEVEHGLATGQPHFINLGLHAFNWAFDREAADGSFTGASSSLYQLGMFVAAASRSSLLLAASPYATRYARPLADYKALIDRAAAYMTRPAVLARGAHDNRHNTHRLYIVGLALSLASSFTGDNRFRAFADDQIRSALRRQWRNGVNPESGGYDSSYQALGVYEAEQWLVYDPRDPLAPRVRGMITRALRWESGRIGSAGALNRSGDTRTHGQEISPYSGTVKTPSYVSIVRALAYWAANSHNAHDAQLARAVANRYLHR